MITDVAGIRVGHWSDTSARTGCTVVRFPEGTVASGEIRGGAPATREFALLDPLRMVQRLDALVLTGGSAFGLAAADGVADELADRGIGFATVGGVVPIVVAVALYDLAVGDGSVRPGPAQGRAALAAALGPEGSGPHAVGRVGAGAGATVDKWRGPEHRRDGGLVAATVRGEGGLVVSALVAVNAYGTPGLASTDLVAHADQGPVRPGDSFTNTTIGLVATNAAIDKATCHLVAQSAHDGLARAVQPTHTAADGDAFVVAATGAVDAPVGAVRNAAVAAVEWAIASLDAGGEHSGAAHPRR